MIFKVLYGKKIHLINSQDKSNIKQFSSAIANIFKELPSRYNMSYIDEDGD